MNEFKLNMSLEDDNSSITFIEASAGTGKTYSLAMLYVRMVIEKRFDIQEMLAVTFTNAAVDELKSRVRKFLNIALEIVDDWHKINGNIDFFSDKELSGEKKDIFGFISTVLQKEKSETTDKSLLIVSLLLKKAKNTLDQAHIFTIHGFCLRILDDFSFSSLSNFDNELISSDEELILDAAEKYYKNYIDTLPDNVFSFLMSKNLSVEPILCKKRYCL